MKKRFLAALMAVMMVMAFLPAISFAAVDVTRPVGTDLSAMNTTDLDGNRYTAENLFKKYQLTVLNVWATWCGPCVGEMPHFQKFSEEYEDMGIKMVGILFEDNMSTLQGGKDMLQNKGYTYLNLRFDSELVKVYNNTFDFSVENGSIPDTYLVNNEGIVIAAKLGAFLSYAELTNWVMNYYVEPNLESMTMPETLEVGTNRMASLIPVFNPTFAKMTETEWTSSDESVATVSNKGLVTGISEGTAVITASVVSYEKTFEVKCTVTVKESEALAEGTEYFRQVEAPENGKTYMVVANYGGEYYMMSNEQAVTGKCRMEGTKVLAENMLLVPVTDNGGAPIQILSVEDKNLWVFMGDNEAGFSVTSLKDGRFLGTQRVDGIYRLNTVNKDEFKWAVEDNMLKVVDGKFTNGRQYLTFFEDADKKYVPAFDLLHKDDERVVEILFFERVLVGSEDVEPGENVPGDINGNGILDAGDATLALRAIVGAVEFTDEQIAAADLNENGRLDSGDAGLILRAAL